MCASRFAFAVVARLREADREEKNAAKPLVAWGLDPALQGGHLHRDELDMITRERPIWVIAYAPRFVYLNSPALARSGVPDSTVVHGVQRYEDGRLNGVFAESEATQLAVHGMPVEVSREGGVRGLRHMANVARRAGITTTAEMGFGFRDFELEWAAHAEAVHDPAFPLRMVLVPFEYPLYKTHAGKAADFLLGLADRNSDKLLFHGIKYLTDGSLPAMSARVNRPATSMAPTACAATFPGTNCPSACCRSGTRASRSTVMPTVTKRSMPRSMRWRRCSGCTRASTIGSRSSTTASAPQTKPGA